MNNNGNNINRSYCSRMIEGNNYKTIVRFNQPKSILNNFGELKVCNHCIEIMKSRNELSGDFNADYNLVIDQVSQYQF